MQECLGDFQLAMVGLDKHLHLAAWKIGNHLMTDDWFVTSAVELVMAPHHP